MKFDKAEPSRGSKVNKNHDVCADSSTDLSDGKERCALYTVNSKGSLGLKRRERKAYESDLDSGVQLKESQSGVSSDVMAELSVRVKKSLRNVLADAMTEVLEGMNKHRPGGDVLTEPSQSLKRRILDSIVEGAVTEVLNVERKRKEGTGENSTLEVVKSRKKNKHQDCMTETVEGVRDEETSNYLLGDEITEPPKSTKKRKKVKSHPAVLEYTETEPVADINEENTSNCLVGDTVTEPSGSTKKRKKVKSHPAVLEYTEIEQLADINEENMSSFFVGDAFTEPSESTKKRKKVKSDPAVLEYTEAEPLADINEENTSNCFVGDTFMEPSESMKKRKRKISDILQDTESESLAMWKKKKILLNVSEESIKKLLENIRKKKAAQDAVTESLDGVRTKETLNREHLLESAEDVHSEVSEPLQRPVSSLQENTSHRNSPMSSHTNSHGEEQTESHAAFEYGRISTQKYISRQRNLGLEPLEEAASILKRYNQMRTGILEARTVNQGSESSSKKKKKFSKNKVLTEKSGVLDESETEHPRKPTKDADLMDNPETSTQCVDQEQRLNNGAAHVELTAEQKKVLQEIRKEYRKNAPPRLILDHRAEEVKFQSEESPGKEVCLYDIQNFLIYFLLTDRYPGARLGKILNLMKCIQGLVVVIDGVGWDDYTKCDTELSNFAMTAKMASPISYGGSLFWEFSNYYPEGFLPEPVKEEYQQVSSGSFNKGKCLPRRVVRVESKSDHFALQETIKWVDDCWKQCTKVTEKGGKTRHPHSKSDSDCFPRTHLLLSTQELISNGYPLPGLSPNDFVLSLGKYTPVTNFSPIYGLDCEMCLTDAGSELTRISIVNEDEEVVYERLVKPHNRIRNYLTRYSGITPEMLAGVTTRLEDVQRELASLLPSDVILAGQSLNFDLHALKLIHPYVIDTSICFNMSGDIKRKTKLKILAESFLSWRIQRDSACGHDSIEDSLACLRLVKAKLSKYYEWGNATLDLRNEEEKRKALQLLLERDCQPPEEFEIKFAGNAIADKLDSKPPEDSNSKQKSLPFTPRRVSNPLRKLNEQFSITSTNFFQKLCSPKNIRVVFSMRDDLMMNYWRYLPMNSAGKWLKRFKSSVEKNDDKALHHTLALAKEKKNNFYRNLLFTHISTQEPSDCLSKLSQWLKLIKNECPDSLVCVVLAGREGQSHGGFFSHIYSDPPEPPLRYEDPRLLEILQRWSSEASQETKAPELKRKQKQSVFKTVGKRRRDMYGVNR